MPPAGRPRKDAPPIVIKAFTPIPGPLRRPAEQGFQPGVIVVKPRPYLAQYFHAPTITDRDHMATHILYWLRKKVKYFTVPKKPPPLEFDPLDIGSYPEYLREDMSQRFAVYTEKIANHIYWSERTAEIDKLLHEGLYARSPWEILLSVYEKAMFQPYERVESIFNIHPLVEDDLTLID
jgi:hypothetical protein